MNSLGFIIIIGIALSGAFLWLQFSGHKLFRTDASFFPIHANDALPTAKHFVYFPQIRQALSAADSRYLRETAPPQILKKALRERRSVARRFLKGLHEDFSNLAMLGRIVASLSPEISRQQETERLMLTLKFQVLYSLVLLRLSAGNLPLEQLGLLTGIVERLATRMDTAMAEISALSAGQYSGGLGA